MRRRGLTRGVISLCLAAGTAIAGGGCGATAIPPVPKGRVPVLTHQTRLPARHAIGSTVRVVLSATTLDVRIEKVIDPLTDSGAQIPRGTTPVGVMIAVSNSGPESYDSSATSDFTLLTAAGPAMPMFAPTGTCETYVQDFMNELGPGQARTGCIAYRVPRGQTPRWVRFTPYGGHEGRPVTWTVSAR